MGNCLFIQPPVTWVDDEEIDDGELYDHSLNLINKQKADESSICPKAAIAATATTKVRVRISKKQLDELLRRAEVKGMSAKDVMLDIINMSLGDSHGSYGGHHWRPELYSIAEEPEHISGFNDCHLC